MGRRSMDFHEQDIRDAKFKESCFGRFLVKTILRICEFRFITGIMAGLYERCL